MGNQIPPVTVVIINLQPMDVGESLEEKESP